MLQKTVDLVVSKPLVTLRDLAYAFAGSLFIALCAQISFTLPFTAVPTSCQAQAVLLTAAVLGGKRGFLAVVAYLFEGAIGLPVFAQLHGGAFVLFGFTAGYLWSYLPVSLLVGYASQIYGKHQLAMGATMVIANVVIIAMGTAWLSGIIGASAGWTLGAAPFIVTDLLKVVMATILLPVVNRLLRGHLDHS